MKFAKALIIGAVLSAGAAFAEEKRTDPNAIARGELMTTIGKNTGVLGDMAAVSYTHLDVYKRQPRKTAPSSVSATALVERWKRLVPSRASSAAMPRVTAGGELPILRAAAANPPSLATATNISRVSSRSIDYSTF